MKRWISLFLAVVLSVSGSFRYSYVISAENAKGAENIESTEKLENIESTEKLEDIENTEKLEDIGSIENVESAVSQAIPATSGNDVIADSCKVQRLKELYVQGNLQFTEGIQVAIEEKRKEDGLLVTATGAQFASGKCFILPSFSFEGKMVGRVSVDAVAPKGVSVSMAVYLDEGAEPVAVIPLVNQKKSGKWNVEGDKTANVLEQHITGSHRVSFQILTESQEPVTVLLRSVEFAENSLPVAYFDLDERQGTILGMHQDPFHETECYGSMTLQIPEGYVGEYTAQGLSTQTYELEYIRGRGNSTWMQDKKPYKLKLSKKADLFGMGANKHWVLLANRLDNSMLRNKITYWLGEEMGMAFTPRSAFVEVVMNGVYYGTYCLSEQVRVGKSRVDIDDLEDTEETKQATDEPIITGGYLLSMEPEEEGEKKSFVTEWENHFLVESPSFEGYENEAQYNYIQNYVQKTEDAIYGEGFKGEDGKGYGEWMDVDSAIDYYWVQEVSKNGDAFATNSTYLYKVRDGKLYWGPLWDFDYVAWASAEYGEEWEEGTYAEFVQNGKSWFSRLFEDRAFAKRAVGRWPFMREKLRRLCEEGGKLDQYYGQIATACQYDYEKWGMHDFGQEKELTLGEEKERLKQWILERTAWIDEHVESFVPEECTVKFMSNGKLCSTKKVLVGSYIGQLPVPSARKGYVFAGWFARGGDGLEYRVYPGYCVDRSVTLKASWIKKEDVQNVEKLYFMQKDVYVPYWEGDYSIPYDVMPLNATFEDVVWTSSDEQVATVEDGFVQFQNPGTVKVTGTCHNGIKASFRLHILEEDEEFPGIEALTLNKASMKLKPGKWGKLGVQAEPANCDTRSIVWISLDPEVAYVTGTGLVVANSEGSTTVLALDSNTRNFAKCKVTVQKTVEKGDVFTVGYLQYKVAKIGKDGAVACIGIDKSKWKEAKAAVLGTGKSTNAIGWKKAANTAVSMQASLQKVKVPASVKWRGKVYQVTSIGKKAFQKANMKTVTLGKNIKSIGEGAFQGCKKLKSVTIGIGLKKIGKEAFQGCPNLAGVTIQSQKLKGIGKKAFLGISKKAVIKVPKKKAKAYEKMLKPATGYRKTMAVRRR